MLLSLGTVSIKTGAAAFFEDIYLDLGVRVFGMVSSTLVELQAIALALECIPPFCSVDLFSDSQAGYSGVLDNEQADTLAKTCFLRGGDFVVSGNSRHFVHDVFRSIGSGSWVVVGGLCGDIDWSRSSLVWHPNSHMAAGSTSAQTAGL
ncbi:hypothetical protein G9A89_014651 [Geosiphon pyriformis]|nr:hypothetical protein G9A89_014651 [Geosiphon pyriformis]